MTNTAYASAFCDFTGWNEPVRLFEKENTMSNKPAFTLRDGAIKATAWANDSEKGTFYSVDVIRSYKDGDDNWQETSSFSGSDILRASNLLQSAYNQILNLKAESSD